MRRAHKPGHEQMAEILVSSGERKQSALGERLRQAGHVVTHVRNLDEVSDLLQTTDVSLMIVDLDQHKLKRVAEYADNWQGVPIVFQSSDPELRNDFRSWIADEFLLKSEKHEKVTEAVNRLLS